MINGCMECHLKLWNASSVHPTQSLTSFRQHASCMQRWTQPNLLSIGMSYPPCIHLCASTALAPSLFSMPWNITSRKLTLGRDKSAFFRQIHRTNKPSAPSSIQLAMQVKKKNKQVNKQTTTDLQPSIKPQLHDYWILTYASQSNLFYFSDELEGNRQVLDHLYLDYWLGIVPTERVAYSVVPPTIYWQA